MKKLLTIVSILALSASFVSCGMFESFKARWSNMEKSSEATEAVAVEPAAPEYPELQLERFYSNAYDGYVNIRQQPTTKSAIIGVLRNGNKYVEKVGVHGNWIMVKWENLVGYAHKSMLGRKPWKPFNLNITADQIEGVYAASDGIYCVYNKGKFTYLGHDWYGDGLSHGRWKFEGNDIILTTKYVTAEGKDMGLRVGTAKRLTIHANGNKVTSIGSYSKFNKSEVYDFNGQKKRAAQLVR